MLDFKIGFKTAFLFDKGFIGNTRHQILDNYMSTSSQLGFRLEGATDIKIIKKLAKKYKKQSNYKFFSMEKNLPKIALYNLNTYFVFEIFFEKNIKFAKKLLHELMTFWNKFVQPNIYAASKGKESIGFIGSSILLVKGESDITFKLIDFSHPFWATNVDFNKDVSRKKHLEIVENYTNGIKNFIKTLTLWIKMKDPYFDYNIYKDNKGYINDNYKDKYTNTDISYYKDYIQYPSSNISYRITDIFDKDKKNSYNPYTRHYSYSFNKQINTNKFGGKNKTRKNKKKNKKTRKKKK